MRSRDVWIMARPVLRAAIKVGCAFLVALAPAHGKDADGTITIAVADFDYRDTSGEARDQRAEHEARLKAFTKNMRAKLAATGKYGAVPLGCDQESCSAGRIDPNELIASAKAAGARLVLFGGIQKMSTLVGFATVKIIDVNTNKLVYDRFLTFRGDNDDAWAHLEHFIARDLATLVVP